MARVYRGPFREKTINEKENNTLKVITGSLLAINPGKPCCVRWRNVKLKHSHVD